MSARNFLVSRPKKYGTVSVTHENGVQRVKLHQTVVAEFDGETARLNSGGWKTVTTKTAINNALSQWGFPVSVRVSQKNFQWALGKESFFDGIEADL